MTVELTAYEQEMLDGKQGDGTRMAMSIIVRMADFMQASRLLEISAAHIDSTIYFGAAGLEFAERLAAMGARVAVPTTTNVTALDAQHWQEWDVTPEWASKATRHMSAYTEMGCRPTWTCAPYQTELIPDFGQQIAWAESNAIVFANSVLGARTNRYPDLMDICAAITGRVPETGLHLTENRAGQLIFDLADIPESLQRESSFYPVLGSLLGKRSGMEVPVVINLKVTPVEDDLKSLGAASASSGAVALFHIVGVTPEAPTLEAACQERGDVPVIRVTMDMLRGIWQGLTTATGEALDMVVLGSPHFSLYEFQQLVPLVKGRKKHEDVRFVITSSRAMALLAHKAGLLEPLKAFGVEVSLDTCILVSPMLPDSVKRLMTNSGKYAYYAPGMLKTEITFGSLQDCVDSAEIGRVTRDESLWEV